MATNYPSSLDTSTQQPTIASSDEMDDSGKEHDVVHTNHSGAIIALETKLGTGDSNAVADAVLMGTGSGTSAWDTSPTFKGAVTVGVDGTGHDVIFYGDTATNGWAWWDQSEDAFIVGPAGHLAFGESSPSWPVEFATDDDLTAFEGTGKGGVCIANSQLDTDGSTGVGDYTALDFTYTGVDVPLGRIACRINSYGSELMFGTSGSYGSGITNTAMTINKDGTILVGADGSGHDVYFYSGTASSYVRWDESNKQLDFFGNATLDFSHSTVGSSNYQIYFAESYRILADNTGTGTDNTRLWIDGPDTGTCYIGPRGGSDRFEDIVLRGDVTVQGALSKSSGSFDIAHPIKGGDWRLRHSFIEGPTCDNIYRGTVTLSSGPETIDLDTVSGMTNGTWEALNSNPWSMVASSGNAVTWSLSGKTLTINGPSGAVCNWMVIGERKDDEIKDAKITNGDGELIVEYENPHINVDADEPS